MVMLNPAARSQGRKQAAIGAQANARPAALARIMARPSGCRHLNRRSNRGDNRRKRGMKMLIEPYDLTPARAFARQTTGDPA